MQNNKIIVNSFGSVQFGYIEPKVGKVISLMNEMIKFWHQVADTKFNNVENNEDLNKVHYYCT